ncbi:MAG: hypothetical protein ACYDHY_19475 [Acidiferrobacterales bacterium]
MAEIIELDGDRRLVHRIRRHDRHGKNLDKVILSPEEEKLLHAFFKEVPDEEMAELDRIRGLVDDPKYR